MKRKISILMLIMVLAIMSLPIMSFANTNDYNDGLLDSDLIETHDLPSEMLDNTVNTTSRIDGNESFTVTFTKPIDIKGYFFEGNFYPGNDENMTLTFSFDNGNGENYSFDWNQIGYRSLDFNDVTSITIEKNNGDFIRVDQIEFFGTPSQTFDNISNLTETVTHNQLDLTYDVPSSSDFDYAEFTINGQTKEGSDGSVSFDSLSQDTTYDLEYTSYYSDGSTSLTDTMTVITETEPSDPTDEIENLEYQSEETAINLTFDNPTENFDHSVIYVDGSEHGTTTEGSYAVDGLESETSYDIKVATISADGLESEGVSTQVETAPPYEPGINQISNLQANYNEEEKQIDLTWDNPEHYFDKAVIYRRSESAEQTAFSLKDLNPFEPMTVHAAEAYEPVFETNGTSFSDLTVDEEVEYEYKVTTMYDGQESEGVTVKTSTIPPLADTSDLTMPFGVADLIKSGNGLLGLVGGFVLLALAFIFVPKIIRLIRQSFSSGQAGTQQSKSYEPGGRLPRETRTTSYIPREPRTSKRGG